MDGSDLRRITETVAQLDRGTFAESCRCCMEAVRGIASQVRRAQVYVFGLFCFYRRFGLRELPDELLRVQELLCGCGRAFEETWDEFASDAFVESLEHVAAGDAQLMLVVELVRTRYGSISGPSVFLEFLGKCRGQRERALAFAFPHERERFAEIIDWKHTKLMDE